MASDSGQASFSSQQSASLVTIADLSNLRVEAAVDQADISKVKAGQKVGISLDALPAKKFSGRIHSVDPVPQTSQNVVTYTVYITFDETPADARLGMSADLKIELEKKENALTVPNVAVRSRGGKSYVAKVVDGKATEVEVVTGLSDDERTEIVSGLSAGDRITTQSFSTSAGGSSGSGRGTFGGGGFGGGGRGPMMIQGGNQ